jgi:hypothetical protein
MKMIPTYRKLRCERTKVTKHNCTKLDHLNWKKKWENHVEVYTIEIIKAGIWLKLTEKGEKLAKGQGVTIIFIFSFY